MQSLHQGSVSYHPNPHRGEYSDPSRAANAGAGKPAVVDLQEEVPVVLVYEEQFGSPTSPLHPVDDFHPTLPTVGRQAAVLTAVRSTTVSQLRPSRFLQFCLSPLSPSDFAMVCN